MNVKRVWAGPITTRKHQSGHASPGRPYAAAVAAVVCCFDTFRSGVSAQGCSAANQSGEARAREDVEVSKRDETRRLQVWLRKVDAVMCEEDFGCTPIVHDGGVHIAGRVAARVFLAQNKKRKSSFPTDLRTIEQCRPD